MSNQLKVMAAKQMGNEAGRHATQGVSQLSSFVRENNWSLRGLSFLGSLAMIILSILKIANFFGILTDFFGYVINVYSALFAYVMLMIEAKDNWPLVEKSRGWIFSNFGFLKGNLGRGLFEIFIGGIWMTTSSLWVFWIGIYVIGIGAVYIVTHLGGCCGKTSESPTELDGSPSPILATSSQR